MVYYDMILQLNYASFSVNVISFNITLNVFFDLNKDH